MIYTPLCPGLLSVRVGDSSWRSEEIVKNLELRLSMRLLLLLIINSKLDTFRKASVFMKSQFFSFWLCTKIFFFFQQCKFLCNSCATRKRVTAVRNSTCTVVRKFVNAFPMNAFPQRRCWCDEIKDKKHQFQNCYTYIDLFRFRDVNS